MIRLWGRHKLFVIVLLLLGVTPKLAAADAPSVAMVDQLVSLPFLPSKVLLVQKLSDDSVRLYPGSVLPNRLPGKHGIDNILYLLVAPVSLEPADSAEEDFSLVFLLFDANNNFYGTAVQTMSWEELRQNSESAEELQLKTEELTRRKKITSVEATDMQQKLEGLRDEASKIAGVDEIIDLKMELVQLKGFGEEHAQELERLRELVEYGRGLADPANIDQQRQELMSHLTEAAKVTSVAERLNSRRRQTAVATVQAKLNLIRRMRNVDSNALAKEALRLRAIRRQLEVRLGIAPTEGIQDF